MTCTKARFFKTTAGRQKSPKLDDSKQASSSREVEHLVEKRSPIADNHFKNKPWFYDDQSGEIETPSSTTKETGTATAAAAMVVVVAASGSSRWQRQRQQQPVLVANKAAA